MEFESRLSDARGLRLTVFGDKDTFTETNVNRTFTMDIYLMRVQ